MMSCKYIFEREVEDVALTLQKRTLKEVLSIESEIFISKFDKQHKKTGEFYQAQQYILYGKEINFWRTVETSCNSFNYFTDGVVSTEYFIVEGYLKHKEEFAHVAEL